MLPYLSIIAVTLGISWLILAQRGEKSSFALSLLAMPPAILAAFRLDIGPDYYLYERIFDTIALTGDFFSVKRLEWGYIALNRLISNIGGSYQLLLFLIAYIIVYCYFCGIGKMSSNFVLSVFLFFAIGTYFDSFNGLRQYIAAAILFASYPFVSEHRPIGWTVACLAASLFHQSAMLLIPFYFVGRYLKLDTKRVLILSVVILILGNAIFAGVRFLLQFSRYSYFLTSSEFETNPTTGAIVLTSISLLLQCLAYQQPGVKWTEMEISLNAMNFFAFITAILSNFVPLMFRIQYYFIPFTIVAIPVLLSKISNKNIRFLIGLTIIGCITCMTFIGMYKYGWYGAYPYKSVGL